VLQLPFSPDLPLRTERLRLRPFQPGDFDALFAFHSLPDAVRYVPFEPRTRESMQVNLNRKLTSTLLEANGDLLEFAVTLGAEGPLIGDLLLILQSAENSTVEIGYIFDPAHSGHGYATEAVRALLGVAFDQLGAHRVIARIDARNRPSLAVCDRLGLRAEAHLVDNAWLKGEWTSEIDYAMLDREWQA
jgi:RimJ/RimL family protein N-acetyltransferase